MPNSRQAKKRLRQDGKRTLRNKMHQSRLRTHLRRAREALAAGDAKVAADAVRLASSYLDRASKTGIIHDNEAARRKSRMQKQLNAMSAPATASA